MIDAAKVDALAAIEVFTGLETRYPGHFAGGGVTTRARLLLTTRLSEIVTEDALVTRMPSKLVFWTVNPVTTTSLRGLKGGLASRPSM